MICPKCGSDSKNARVCPSCGFNMAQKNRSIPKIIGGIFCIIVAIGGLSSLLVAHDVADRAVNGILTVVFATAAFLLLKDGGEKKASKKELAALEAQQAEEARRRRIAEVSALTELPVVSHPSGVLLRPGEICHYQTDASVVVMRNQVVGHTGGHSGVSVRVAKGVTLHTAGSRGHSVRADVPYIYPGTFTMTNQRMIMTGEKGFEYPISKLAALTPWNHAEGVIFQFGRSTHIVEMSEPYWIQKILDLLRDSVQKAPGPSPVSAEISMDRTQTEEAPEEMEPSISADLSYLDAQALKFWNKKRTDFVIPTYYAESAFGRNVGPALQRLLEKGYLHTGDMSQRIALKTIPELKAILAERELKVSGNKKELIARLMENCDTDMLEALFPVNVYQITEAGKAALVPYSIIEDSESHALDFSHYRLLKAKAAHPELENNVILAGMLSEDLQRCYQTQNRSQYQVIIDKAARFTKEIGEFQLSFECYALQFFMWTREIEEHKLAATATQTYYMAKNLEQAGALCGYDFAGVISTFEETIKRVNPFLLGTPEHIEYCIQVLKSTLNV